VFANYNSEVSFLQRGMADDLFPETSDRYRLTAVMPSTPPRALPKQSGSRRDFYGHRGRGDGHHSSSQGSYRTGGGRRSQSEDMPSFASPFVGADVGSIGWKLLQKAAGSKGWELGRGLGAKEQGMDKLIQVRASQARSLRIVRSI
jgi:hypothetical protein